MRAGWFPLLQERVRVRSAESGVFSLVLRRRRLDEAMSGRYRWRWRKPVHSLEGIASSAFGGTGIQMEWAFGRFGYPPTAG